MAYYVTGCIAGTMEEDNRYETLEEAREVQKERNADLEDEYWIVVGEDGEEIKW